MGGAYLLATDDATTVAWNPAALVNVKRFTLPIEVSGRANFDVRDVRDLGDALKDIRDEIGPSPDLRKLAAALKDVRDWALKNGAISGGTSATLTAVSLPLLA